MARAGSALRGVDEIVAQEHDGRTRLVVRGDLDLATRDEFIRELTRALERGRVEIDLRELEYIDSVGLSTLIEADRMATAAPDGERVRILVAPEGAVRRMVELTLLHLTLDVRHG